jgi:hypothetical protein
VRLKYLTTGIAAAGLVGAAAAGVTSIASAPTTPAVTPVVFGVPLPQQPIGVVPTSGELMGLLNSLADPSVPFRSKSGLVEGGVGILEGKAADRAMASAASEGKLPLKFTIANIAPAGDNAVTADVTATGPIGNTASQNVTFVNEGSWKLSRASALSLLQAASG